MSEVPSVPFGRLLLQNVRCFRDTTIELDPKLTVFVVLVGVILSLSYFGRRDEPHAKVGGGRRTKRGKR